MKKSKEFRVLSQDMSDYVKKCQVKLSDLKTPKKGGAKEFRRKMDTLRDNPVDAQVIKDLCKPKCDHEGTPVQTVFYKVCPKCRIILED